MNTDSIKKTYNQLAHLYNQDRKSLGNSRYLSKFIQLLKPQSYVLDLGCGNGLPVAKTLLKKGHLVTGIDISQTQINLAKKNCLQGEFLLGDMAKLKNGQYSVDGVLSFYTIFHLPRTQHLAILQKINSFLPEGGPLLISMGDKDFEGMHDFYGSQIWSSHYGPAKNRQLVEQAGFEILLDEIDTSGREKHQIILAKKNS
jgi:SAM-dependent methyltransferase